MLCKKYIRIDKDDSFFIYTLGQARQNEKSKYILQCHPKRYCYIKIICIYYDIFYYVIIYYYITLYYLFYYIILLYNLYKNKW